MNLVVIKGFRHPEDASGKQRYAVILGTDAVGDFIIAPCTTYPERTNTTPRGSARLTDRSPAYKGAGFTAKQVAISIRDKGNYSFDSNYLRDAEKVGSLQTRKDSEFEAWLKELMEIYNVKPVGWA